MKFYCFSINYRWTFKPIVITVRELGDDALRNLVIELIKQLRKSATVDWQKRESVRARMHNLVRRLRHRWKYPPDATEEAIKLVLEQAEVLADGWYK